MVKVYQDGAALVALDTAAYDSGKDLVLDGDSFQLTSNVVIKSTVTINRNVLIDLNGFNITFSRDLFAGEYQIFTGLGNILGKNISVAYSDWVAPVGDGYVLDPLTADDVAKTYVYEGVTIPFGTAPNVTFTDDTAKLQQFLNIKARELIISEGVYMIDPHGNKPYDHIRGGLLYRDMVGATLRINGTLKNIRGTKVNGNILRFYRNVGCTVIGNKGLNFQGDLLEHTLSPFDEGGTGVYIAACHNCYFKDFETNLCTGDATMVTFTRTYGDTNLDSTYLYFKNIIGNYCRRTGHVIEVGENMYHSNCTWNHNGLHRNGGAGTWSGVDIEPMGWADVNKRFADQMHFHACTASGNFGGGLRMERVLSGSITSCDLTHNSHAIELLQVGRGNEDITGPNDRSYYTSRVIVEGNFIENNNNGIISNIEMASEVMLSNNSFQDNISDISGRYIRSFFKDNIFRGTRSYWLYLTEAKDVVVSGNTIIDLKGRDNLHNSKLYLNPYNEMGAIDSFSIINGGSGYSSKVKLIINNTGTARGAVGIAKLDSNGSIVDVIVHNTGSGYTSNPAITVEDSTGTGAIIEAHYRPSIDNCVIENNQFILTIPPNGIARGIMCPTEFVKIGSEARNFKWLNNYVDPRHYQKTVINTINTKSSLVRNFQADLMRPQKLMKHDIVHSDSYNFGRAYVVSEGSLPYGRDFQPNHEYKVGDIIKTSEGKMYWCKTAGLSSSIAPDKESGDITNGTAVFIFKDKMFSARAINYL